MKRNKYGLSSSRVVFTALLALFVAFAGFSGCAKDTINDADNLGGAVIKTTIVGKIVDEAGQPVAGATVTGASLTTVTNKYGIFILKDAQVSSARCYVIAKKAGFFTAARAESPVANGVTSMRLGMMTNTTTFNVVSSTGGTLALGSGATVQFDPNSFVTSNGTPYTGAVKVSARYLDPARTDFFDYFSGDNAGRQTDNTEVGLKSVGVIRVELRDASGNMLSLANGSKATLSVPKPASMATAPNTMPLWYFDETIGEWKEDGSATLQSGKYVGTVSHFTDWNFDYKGETGELSARVLCNGIPVEGVVISIFQRDITTGGDGRIHIRRVPADQQLSLDISSIKNGGLYFINTPIAVNIVPGQTLDLGDITLNSLCPASISGTILDCGDTKMEALIMLTTAAGDSRFVYTGSGTFSMSAPAGTGLTLVATDPNGNESSPLDILPLSSGEQRNVGIIKVCGTANSSFIDVTLGNTKEGTTIALSPDGSLLAVGAYPNSFQVYETKTGTKVSNFIGTGTTQITALQFTTDNKKLLVSLSSGNCTVYDVSTATPTSVTSLTLGASDRVNGAHIYDDGSKIIAMVSGGGTTSFRLFSGVDGSLIKTLTAATNLSDSAGGAFGFDRSEDAVIYLDKSNYHDYIVWSIANDAIVRTITTPKNYNYSSGYSEEGQSFGFIAGNSSNISFYNALTGAKINDVSAALQSTNRYGGLLLTKDYAYFASAVDSVTTLRIVDINSAKTVFTKLLSSNSYISVMAANREQTFVAANTNKGFIRVWKFQ